MRIVIVDDHPVVLVGLKATLHGYDAAFRIVGEARDGMQVMAALAGSPCDLLITDFSMPTAEPSEDGLGMLKRIRATYPNVHIIVLSMVQSGGLLQRMLDLGVRGLVDKHSMTKDLCLAIEAVRSGRIYVADNVRKRLPQQLDASEVVSLSARESEIVRMFSFGLTVSEISRRTGRSVKTVSQQKRDAMRKLGIESDKELFDYARFNGML
ncbi:response regulator transcription factor [Dyella japonica]|uniref:Two-component system capsular synthesis response regulator RcsB n=1 Tax=Dyella japonica TaxID=231455 RepID=A0ABV2JPC9_9GAMM